MLEDVAVLAHRDALDASVRMLHGDAALVQVDRDAQLLGSVGERLPHLPRPEPRIAELLDQRRHVFAPKSEDRQDRLVRARSS